MVAVFLIALFNKKHRDTQDVGVLIMKKKLTLLAKTLRTSKTHTS
jgi:hypothetical protein